MIKIIEVTNASSVGGGHVGSIDIIGTCPIPISPDLSMDLELDKIHDKDEQTNGEKF